MAKKFNIRNNQNRKKEDHLKKNKTDVFKVKKTNRTKMIGKRVVTNLSKNINKKKKVNDSDTSYQKVKELVLQESKEYDESKNTKPIKLVNSTDNKQCVGANEIDDAARLFKKL